MLKRKFKIKTYQVEFRSSTEEEIAVVYLYDERSVLLAMIAFVEREGPLPGPKENPAGKIMLTYHRRALHEFVDILRHEEPMFFLWSNETQTATISTAEEPVGDEDAKSFLATIFKF